MSRFTENAPENAARTASAPFIGEHSNPFQDIISDIPIVPPLLGDTGQSDTKPIASVIKQGRPRVKSDSSSSVDFDGEWGLFEEQRKSLHQKDVTVHLEMGITEDIESLFEEFSRLKRIGHFGAAEQYFEDNLKRYIDIPPVLVGYADLMLEKGAYNTLSKLELTNGLNSEHALYQDYETILDQIQCIAAIHSVGLLKQAEDHVNRWKGSLNAFFSRDNHLNPYKIQQIRYFLEILSLLQQNSCWVPDTHWESIQGTYELLLNEGRVWEARDILIVAAGMDSDSINIRWILNDATLSVKSINNFLQHWIPPSYDESSYLALLEVLAILTCSLIYSNVLEPNPAEVNAARLFLEYARDLATCIQRNTAELVKSRPYLRWMLAEETMARSNDLPSFCLRTYLEKFPGLKIEGSPVPMYIPLTVENPGWPKPNSKHLILSNNHLETLLNVSRELRDLRMEAACLGEMIYRSPEPSDLFNQLLSLQKDVQQDTLGSQRTCISKFLIIKDEISCRSLLHDLDWAYSNGWQSPGCPLIDWSVIVVKQALERLWLQSEQSSSLSAAYEVADELPPSIRYELLLMRHQGIGRDLPVSKKIEYEERIPIQLPTRTMKMETHTERDCTDEKPEDLSSNSDTESSQPAAFGMEWAK